MAIDDIKPTGNFGQLNYPSGESTGEGKPNRNFSVVPGPQGAANTESVSSSAAATKFSRADLQDPAKLDHAVRSSASELVNSQAASSSMSSEDKKFLSDFLTEDPLLRQRIETYLRKAAP